MMSGVNPGKLPDKNFIFFFQKKLDMAPEKLRILTFPPAY